MATTTTRSGVQDYGKAVSEAADETLDSARSVRDTVASSASTLADQAKEAAGPVIDTVRERAQQFGNRAQDAAGEAYDQTRRAARAVNRQIGDQPLFTALAAFAIGYGMSYLLHGQR